MIAQIKGQVVEVDIEKDFLHVVVDVQGVGYELLMTLASEPRLTAGQTRVFYVSESVTAFDGATTLYGFISKEEKDFFKRIRENVDGMGPKKALECMDKISKSMPDFKRAIIEGDLRILVSVFGFTKKTAEKLVFSLKGKMDSWNVSGPVKWQDLPKGSSEEDAVSGLLNLGYREDEARELVAKVKTNLGEGANTEVILGEALRLMGRRIS